MVQKKVITKKKITQLRQDPLFVPIVYNSYKNNKMNLLKIQVKSLECIKTINNIQLLQRKKEFLKKELYIHLSEAIKIYYHIQDSLPILSNPQFSKKFEKTVETAINCNNSSSSLSISKKISKPDELDDELREIQSKLNSLNSLREYIN